MSVYEARFRLEIIKAKLELIQSKLSLYHEIIDLDCLVRDMKIGLIDFISIREEVPVWLCFKLGEEGLNYYHGMHDGYLGRKLIDF